MCGPSSSKPEVDEGVSASSSCFLILGILYLGFLERTGGGDGLLLGERDFRFPDSSFFDRFRLPFFKSSSLLLLTDLIGDLLARKSLRIRGGGGVEDFFSSLGLDFSDFLGFFSGFEGADLRAEGADEDVGVAALFLGSFRLSTSLLALVLLS